MCVSHVTDWWTECILSMTWSMMGLAPVPRGLGQDKWFTEWINGFLQNEAGSLWVSQCSSRTTVCVTLFCALTMSSCGPGSDRCGPPDRTCCCWVPCTLRAQTHSRWPGRTRCCGRSLPGPLRLRQTPPATSRTLRQKERTEETFLINAAR